MSYSILLNADHSIHTKDNQIVTIPDSMAFEDCECCGPPQPPPGCQRCIKYVDGEPVYYPPFQKDIAFVASNIPNTFTVSWTEHFHRKTGSSFNINDPYGFCGCVEELFETSYSLTLSGFAALNGTYYGVPTGPFGTNPAGGFSTVPACNPGGIAFNPGIWVPPDSCDPVDPCDYECIQTVYHLQVPITGTQICNSKVFVNCKNNPTNPQLNTNDIRTVTSSITGWAYIYLRPDGPYTVSFGAPTDAPAYDIAMQLLLTTNTGYDTLYEKRFYTGWPKRHPRETGACGPIPYRGYQSWGLCSYPGTTTPQSYPCAPEWKSILNGQSHTCVESASQVPTFDEQFPACDYYIERTTPIAPNGNCDSYFIYEYIQKQHSATRQTGQIIWT